jgi:hypothetical protein
VFGEVTLEGRFGIVLTRLDGPTLAHLSRTGAMTLQQVGAILGMRELNCTFPGAGATTRLGCAKGMASSEDGRGVV